LNKLIDEKRFNQFPLESEQTLDSLNNSLSDIIYESWNDTQTDDSCNFYQKFSNLKKLSRKMKKQKTKFLKHIQKSEKLSFSPDVFLKKEKVSKFHLNLIIYLFESY
jgi:hypothetical protein